MFMLKLHLTTINALPTKEKKKFSFVAANLFYSEHLVLMLKQEYQEQEQSGFNNKYSINSIN